MYDCYDACVVYGWREGDNGRMIDYKWLCGHLIGNFAIDVANEHGGNFVYGKQCDIDEVTGLVTISAAGKKLVENAHRQSGSEWTLGYYIAMRGDYEYACHTIYVPDARLSDNRPSSPPAKKSSKTDDDNGGCDSLNVVA